MDQTRIELATTALQVQFAPLDMLARSGSPGNRTPIIRLPAERTPVVLATRSGPNGNRTRPCLIDNQPFTPVNLWAKRRNGQASLYRLVELMSIQPVSEKPYDRGRAPLPLPPMLVIRARASD